MASGKRDSRGPRGSTRKAPARPAPKAARNGSPGAGRIAPRSAPPPEVELDAEVMEFIAALDRYRKEHSRPFPSWSEVMHVLRALGYRKRG